MVSTLQGFGPNAARKSVMCEALVRVINIWVGASSVLWHCSTSLRIASAGFGTSDDELNVSSLSPGRGSPADGLLFSWG